MQLSLGELRCRTRFIKLAHCAIMKKNPHCTNFGNVVMHNGLGSTNKALCVNLPTITCGCPHIGNNVFLLSKVQANATCGEHMVLAKRYHTLNFVD